MIRKRSVVKKAKGRRQPSGAAVLQPDVTAALTKALFIEWSRRGYGALSLEAVAKRAGVGKAALYRRWPSKLAMVTDRLEQIDFGEGRIPDTGSLEGDIRELLTDIWCLLRRPLVKRILTDLHAEMARDSSLAQAVRGRLQQVRRGRAMVVLRRAIDRGELVSDLDVELIIDALGSLIYWRMVVTGECADRRYLDGLVSFMLSLLTELPPRVH